jgi:hypothetical protein
MRTQRRALLWAIVIAAIVGVGVGWFARKWYHPTAEERAREQAEDIRERIRELTH